jgi:hypothetical protein
VVDVIGANRWDFDARPAPQSNDAGGAGSYQATFVVGWQGGRTFSSA